MKVLVLLAASAVLMIAQDAKVAVPTQAIPAPAMERGLTETEILKLQNAMLQIDNLKKVYKIDEFNEKVQPISESEQVEYVSACKSIGLTDEQIKAQECGFSLGVDMNGKPITGPDGKPVQSRVWRNKPAPVVEPKK